MGNERHGISIGIERNGDDFYLSFVATGSLTHEDYEQMVPLLESALIGIREPDIHALADLRGLKGMSLHAVWDDLKLGFSHGKEFKKMAILGKGGLQEWMSKMADWFTPGEIRFFEGKEEALNWLK
ncbi:conserved hypothetical protein [Shewanella sediminis HAW-EB3]|uniref:STAS/SEC14 domain-containing protein n=1 Tax=Shewanella sediminis (strain HAW-EB3) TaxID=425104 RepID=A8FZP6_SHESH|nr:STAS/SEC14 domain-containing protein [Shewanella sediminis]ABV38319.1 conserved hypothetical protein [Shewanella sediminis HAW-EB3]